jgi:hypothetical protein
MDVEYIPRPGFTGGRNEKPLQQRRFKRWTLSCPPTGLDIIRLALAEIVEWLLVTSGMKSA